jgi:hypothetical protein
MAWRVGDLLVFGDPLEDEMLLERTGRGGECGLPQFVDMPTDRVVVEAATTQFEDRPFELTLGLAAEQFRRQIP